MPGSEQARAAGDARFRSMLEALQADAGTPLENVQHDASSGR
jgi:hypothetical protein